MEIIPHVSLYRHSTKPKFAIMRFWKDGSYSVLLGWGPLVHLSEEDVRVRGVDILLGEFREFHQRSAPYTPSETPQELRRSRRFLSECDHVSISLHPGPELWIQPIIVTGRGAGRGEPKDRVVLALPADSASLMSALDTAYSRCAVIYDR